LKPVIIIKKKPYKKDENAIVTTTLVFFFLRTNPSFDFSKKNEKITKPLCKCLILR
jgi:hypothetical protein